MMSSWSFVMLFAIMTMSLWCHCNDNVTMYRIHFPELGIFIHRFWTWWSFNHKYFTRFDMAFIEPMHHNKPNITYLLTYLQILYLNWFHCQADIPLKLEMFPFSVIKLVLFVFNDKLTRANQKFIILFHECCRLRAHFITGYMSS